MKSKVRYANICYKYEPNIIETAALKLALHVFVKMAADVGDLIIKFSKEEYKICGLSGTDTVLDLKNEIYKQTGVLPQHQKLAGFKVKGR